MLLWTPRTDVYDKRVFREVVGIRYLIIEGSQAAQRLIVQVGHVRVLIQVGPKISFKSVAHSRSACSDAVFQPFPRPQLPLFTIWH